MCFFIGDKGELGPQVLQDYPYPPRGIPGKWSWGTNWIEFTLSHLFYHITAMKGQKGEPGSSPLVKGELGNK